MDGQTNKEQLNTPLISVIMSVYNEEKYIAESLGSILNQTESNFEIIIIDDCSKDATAEIINNINDERVIYVKNEENQGLTKNLNKALRMAKGKFIARMDGDDISAPDRFATQIEYLNAHPEIMLISCNTTTFGEENLISDIHGTPEELKCRMLLRPVLAHPGFMFRRELFEYEGYYYDEHFRSAQDYDYAARVTRKFDIQVVPEVLLKYRAHKGQVSQTPNLKQFGFADEIRARLLNEIGIVLSEEEIERFHKWILEKNGNIEDFKYCRELIQRIVKANEALNENVYDSSVLNATLYEQFFIWMLRTNGKKMLFSVCGFNPMMYAKAVAVGVNMVVSKLRRRM